MTISFSVLELPEKKNHLKYPQLSEIQTEKQLDFEPLLGLTLTLLDFNRLGHIQAQVA